MIRMRLTEALLHRLRIPILSAVNLLRFSGLIHQRHASGSNDLSGAFHFQ